MLGVSYEPWGQPLPLKGAHLGEWVKRGRSWASDHHLTFRSGQITFCWRLFLVMYKLLSILEGGSAATYLINEPDTYYLYKLRTNTYQHQNVKTQSSYVCTTFSEIEM